jgi:hypothetical protein
VSEENRQKPKSGADSKELSAPKGDETYEVTLNKSKEELTIKDPSSGRVVTIKARESEEETVEKDIEPLSPEDFSAALKKIDALGLTWTADSIPRVVTKEGVSDDALLSEEFERIQETYPALPRELASIVFHALTGGSAQESIVGSKEKLEKKVATVRELLITSEYRSDFFFKHALKIPYFETIDWEVIFKTHERNVEGMPGIAYALLMLTFHNPNPRLGKLDQHQNVTVAADMNYVDKLISILIDVRTALEEAKGLTDKLNERVGSKDDAERS